MKERPLLDPLLHQPIRTRLTAYLAARGETTFSELKQVLQVTDGNLDAHVKKLLSAGYLITRKQKGSGRTQTLYLLSSEGDRAFVDYVRALQTLLPEPEPVPASESRFDSPQSQKL